MALDALAARVDGPRMATLSQVRRGRLGVPAVAVLVVAVGVLLSVASGAAGSLIYSSSDDRAMAFVFLPAPIVSLVGWALLFVGYRARRTGQGAELAWVLAAALVLPVVGWFGAALGLALGDAIHVSVLQNTGSW